ncbi:MAG: PAS domain S-box protein [Ignavibacteriales bacterium]|nr:PAS domain S-box protein [Ignavibacteriales bacterium]
MKDNSPEKDSSYKNKEIIFDVLDSIPESIIELDVVAQSITDLKETKEALRESEEKYRMVFSNVPLGILHFDSTGRITACNDNFISISDTKKEQIIGALLSEALDVNMVSAIEHTLAGTIGHYEGEYLSKTSGKITPVRVNFAPIILDNGTISGGVGIFEDITERKQIERIFFHDILNTAGSLNNILEILDDDTLGGEERKELMKVLDEIAKRIIDEIITHRHLVSSEKSKIKLNVQKISSINFLKRLYDSFNHSDILGNKLLKISPESKNSEIDTDETLLGRVVSNMIKNAIEASSAGETITLNCGNREGMVYFSVHNPSFIPEDIQLQLFNRSVSTKGAGRGIGIYSMKFLTEKYLNGIISFTSTKKDGTAFEVCYPQKFIVSSPSI